MKRRDLYQRMNLLEKINDGSRKAQSLLEQRQSLQEQRRTANMEASFQRQRLQVGRLKGLDFPSSCDVTTALTLTLACEDCNIGQANSSNAKASSSNDHKKLAGSIKDTRSREHQIEMDVFKNRSWALSSLDH